MSAQIPDKLTYNGSEYALITATNGEFIFETKTYKIHAYQMKKYRNISE